MNVGDTLYCHRSGVIRYANSGIEGQQFVTKGYCYTIMKVNGLFFNSFTIIDDLKKPHTFRGSRLSFWFTNTLEPTKKLRSVRFGEKS